MMILIPTIVMAVLVHAQLSQVIPVQPIQERALQDAQKSVVMETKWEPMPVMMVIMSQGMVVVPYAQ